MVIDIKTRQSVRREAVQDDTHPATTLAGILRLAIATGHSQGLTLKQMRTMLLNVLQYVEAKIAIEEGKV